MHPDGLLNDYCDGSDFTNHPLFSSEQNALQILLYFDELEVCNPLGTKVKKHKLGNSLLNVQPWNWHCISWLKPLLYCFSSCYNHAFGYNNHGRHVHVSTNTDRNAKLVTKL